ncbi:MAG: ribose-5-phosphate isomerase RpiA [Candidatus Bathyarchaeota archaeon]|nr:ribose-5-phosphate isomerase RpiA [Candidatus Termiticorpusculum sp.]MCL2868029.1 ribose-5-phosphate isomerase RpiA [Candidatus Termiticorpusculum sp.]
MKTSVELIQEAKRNAALEAVKHVEDNFVVGLGSGTTVAFAIEALGKRVKAEKLKIMGIPSSYQAFQLAVQHGILVTSLDEHPIIDVTIDGADQVTPELYLIKGMGAALLREKIVAAASKYNIIIVDESKRVKVLGENNQAVPIEVLPFALSLVRNKIAALGGTSSVREGKGKLGPIVTDNGNIIIDVNFGLIHNPQELSVKVKSIPGVVETGFFVGLTDLVYIATENKIEKLRK